MRIESDVDRDKLLAIALRDFGSRISVSSATLAACNLPAGAMAKAGVYTWQDAASGWYHIQSNLPPTKWANGSERIVLTMGSPSFYGFVNDAASFDYDVESIDKRNVSRFRTRRQNVETSQEWVVTFIHTAAKRALDAMIAEYGI